MNGLGRAPFLFGIGMLALGALYRMDFRWATSDTTARIVFAAATMAVIGTALDVKHTYQDRRDGAPTDG